MKKRLTLFLASLFLFMGEALAQTKVNGTVLSQEDGQPIIGAAVRVDGDKAGMLTDANGRFSLTLPAGKNQITVSYLGYESKTVTAKNGMRVFLKQDSKMLDDVIVVGYGTSAARPRRVLSRPSPVQRLLTSPPLRSTRCSVVSLLV